MLCKIEQQIENEEQDKSNPAVKTDDVCAAQDQRLT